MICLLRYDSIENAPNRGGASVNKAYWDLRHHFAGNVISKELESVSVMYMGLKTSSPALFQAVPYGWYNWQMDKSN